MEEQAKTKSSKSPKGHGPGKQTKCGANVVPRSWWIGKGRKKA